MNRRLFLEKMSDNKLKEIFDKIEDAQINGDTNDDEIIFLSDTYYSNKTGIERLLFLAMDIYRECAIRWRINEQILKELGIELKKLELKDDDVLAFEYDIEKIFPKELNDYMRKISKIIDNKMIAFPNDNSLIIYKNKKEDLMKIKEKFNEKIDKILRGDSKCTSQ